MLAFLLAASPLPSAVDAERAFNADAQAMGQWRAFEKWAAKDAVMFVPDATPAREWLKGRQDPKTSVEWAPAASFVSCDGATAINTGPWVRKAQGTVGYFTTVWRRGQGGWRWILDHGDSLASPMPAADPPKVERASCEGHPQAERPIRTAHEARGASADGTLTWHWTVGADGRRTFAAALWDGTRYRPVVANQVDAE